MHPQKAVCRRCFPNTVEIYPKYIADRPTHIDSNTTRRPTTSGYDRNVVSVLTSLISAGEEHAACCALSKVALHCTPAKRRWLEGCDGQYPWVSTNDIVGREVLACHKCGNRNVGRGDCDALDMFFRSTYDPLAGLPEIH
eukprot:g65943.t1